MAATVRTRVKIEPGGLTTLVRQLRSTMVPEVLRDVADSVTAEAKAAAPVKTGRLRDSIRPTVTDFRASVATGPEAPYAGIVARRKPFMPEGKVVARRVKDRLRRRIAQASAANAIGAFAAGGRG